MLICSLIFTSVLPCLNTSGRLHYGVFYYLFVNLKVLNLCFVLPIKPVCTVYTIEYVCLMSKNNWLQKKGVAFQDAKLHFTAHCLPRCLSKSYLSMCIMKKCLCSVSCLISILRGRKEWLHALK